MLRRCHRTHSPSRSKCTVHSTDSGCGLCVSLCITVCLCWCSIQQQGYPSGDERLSFSCGICSKFARPFVRAHIVQCTCKWTPRQNDRSSSSSTTTKSSSATRAPRTRVGSRRVAARESCGQLEIFRLWTCFT